MPFHFKAFVLVMAITSVMFALTKPLFIRFMAVEDYARRRNLWLALTLWAFLIPNFWAYMLVAAVLIGFTASRDSNPAALYLFLLLAVPPIRESIPTFGLVKAIFGLDHLRLLSLVLLLPAAIKLAGPGDSYGAGVWPDGTRKRGVQSPDIFVLLYFAVQVMLMFPYESVTASVRRMLLLSIDMLLPYFVLSRVCRSREMIIDAMASFCLALVVLAPLAAAEFAKGWILYAGLEERWGAGYMMGYVKRGDYLRAQVTGGHAIVFGFAMAIGFGFWLYLQSRVDSKAWRRVGALALLTGLIATLARGPWVGATATLLCFLALGPNPVARSMKAVAAVAAIGGIALATPYGANIIDHLPFIGTVNDETVAYRQRLAEISWMLVQQNPFFGTPYYMAYMEELRQGEGIIDIVNTYAGIALSYGLVGLAFFGGIFLTSVQRCWTAIRSFAGEDPDFSLMGAGLLACIVGVLVMIATTSNYLSIPYVAWSLAGLAFAYAQLSRMPQPSFDSGSMELDVQDAWRGHSSMSLGGRRTWQSTTSGPTST
jgi:O-antigen ligase